MIALAALLVGGPVFQNPGFETPALATNAWVRLPLNALWSFETDSGLANGSGAWGSRANSGAQYIFIQSATWSGIVSQEVPGFTPGARYQVRFFMARRNGHSGGNDPNPIHVKVGPKIIFGPSAPPNDSNWYPYTTNSFVADNTSQLFSFRGSPPGQDRASLIDDVSIEQIGTFMEGVPVVLSTATGTEFSGNQTACYVSDNVHYSIMNNPVSLEAAMRMEGYTMRTERNSITFEFEGSGQRVGLAMQISMFRYDGDTYFPVLGTTNPLFDEEFSITLNTHVADYISNIGQMKSQISWFPINDEDPAQDGWLLRADYAHWTIN